MGKNSSKVRVFGPNASEIYIFMYNRIEIIDEKTYYIAIDDSGKTISELIIPTSFAGFLVEEYG